MLGSGGMKRVFLSFLWRMAPQELARHSRDFARSLMPAIYPELREKLENQRAAGHFLILASASPEFYVAEIGRELGFDLTLGTQVEPGPLFPDLENHKGAAKVARLRAVLPPAYFDDKGKLIACHGYTDSRADLPMLELCDDRHRGQSIAGTHRARANNPAGKSSARPGRGNPAPVSPCACSPCSSASAGIPPGFRRTIDHSSILKKSRITSR